METQRKRGPPPPLNLFKPQSISLHTIPLWLRLSLSHRTHPPTKNLTHIFLLNYLAAHRHLTRPTTLPPATCREFIFHKILFSIFFYGFSSLYNYTGCLAHQIQKNNNNFYITQNVRLLLRHFLFDAPFLPFFLGQLPFIPHLSLSTTHQFMNQLHTLSMFLGFAS